MNPIDQPEPNHFVAFPLYMNVCVNLLVFCLEKLQSFNSRSIQESHDDLRNSTTKFDSMLFALSGTKQKFSVNLGTEPIFNLQKPVTQTSNKSVLQQEQLCNQCLQTKQKWSVQDYCNFCGLNICKECVPTFKKTRLFQQGSTIKGKICRVCDAKFVLR